MMLRVLGAAAGGGFPQWNCNCRNCAGLRAGTLAARARTQSSVIVRGAAESAWALVNASPDVLQQLQHSPQTLALRAVRDTAIIGIVLVDGQIDHTTGLCLLREAQHPWQVWCTDAVHDDLTSGYPVLTVLKHYCGAERRRMPLGDEPFTVDGIEGVQWRALAVAGKPAPYSPKRRSPVAGDNVALVLTDQLTQRSLIYAPGLAGIDEPLWTAMQAARCVLVDGTFWSDDELIAQGICAKRAQDMGHLALCGEGGMLGHLARLPHETRKILIHINNTNPILDEASPEAAELARLDIEVAFDGMEIEW